MNYLLDTNVLSEWRKREPDPGLVEWIRSIAFRRMFVSAVTIGEIRRGITKLERRNDHQQAAAYQAWLDDTKNMFADRLVPVTVEMAEVWGRLDGSRPVSMADGLIAATAEVHGWTVVTRNVKDFAQAGVRVLNPFTVLIR